MSSELDPETGSIIIRELNSFTLLSEFIAEDQDHSAVIFKRFDLVAARNLLYLQSELADLQAQQEELDGEDLRDARVVSDYQDLQKAGRDWSTSRQRSKNDPKFKKRMKLIGLIRKKMKQYRK
jgi:hypothetical protein